MIEIIGSSILMRVKGGGLGKIPYVSGKILSSIGFALLCLYATDSFFGLLGGVGWWVGNKFSLGEIIGAIGGYKGNWRPEGKEWGWKQGVQRGIFTGACIGVCLWNPAFILAGATFPVCVWLGVSLNQILIRKVQASWYLFEILWGAVLGAAFLVP